jgi:hypothetical protein
MNKYNTGTLIILKNELYDYVTYRGIILSLNECDSWWGGGYYNIFWSPPLPPSTQASEKISYNQLVEWERAKEAVVYAIE